MRYVIMCGGKYWNWPVPKHLTMIKGEPLVARTIRLLRECGVEDIAISAVDSRFAAFGVPLLVHSNRYYLPFGEDAPTPWLDAFYPMNEPVCYIFGDVVFSPEAIREIVETETDSIEFFASAKPFAFNYPKRWAEPFAFKVVDTASFFKAIEWTKQYDREGCFKRQPVSWELWQIIKGTELNKIVTNYHVINDYTCDIDEPRDAVRFNDIIF